MLPSFEEIADSFANMTVQEVSVLVGAGLWVLLLCADKLFSAVGWPLIMREWPVSIFHFATDNGFRRGRGLSALK